MVVLDVKRMTDDVESKEISVQFKRELSSHHRIIIIIWFGDTVTSGLNRLTRLETRIIFYTNFSHNETNAKVRHAPD